MPLASKMSDRQLLPQGFFIREAHERFNVLQPKMQ
jgi:hypothetical protein